MMKPLKTPQDYDGQIKRLVEKHGLIVEDNKAAKDILSNVNYYRLSAYGIGLKLGDDPERYQEGVTLDHLFHLHQFDSHLRTLLIPVIEYLEISLRTKIAYHLALTYGAEGYRDKENFSVKIRNTGVEVHPYVMGQLDKEIERQKNLPCVKHHITTYDGHFPVWAAIELFTFGMLSSLFSTMEKEDQKAIAKLYGTDSKVLGGWILALVEVRNICAHYGRIYNMPLKQQPYLYSEYRQYRSNRIFPLLLTMKRMLQGQSVWTNFYTSLVGLVDEYSEIKKEFMGFPENWEEILK